MQKEQEQQEQEKQEKRPQPTRYRSEMPLDQLMPSPENARRRFEDGPLRDLADSIRSQGVTNPLTVVLRESASDEKPTYTVIAGERRRRAAILAGLTEVPVICLFDPHLIDQAPQIALAENLLRQPLNPYEETMAILDLVANRLARQSKWPTYREHYPSDRHAAAEALRLLALGGKNHEALRTSLKIEPSELEKLLTGLLGERDGMSFTSFVKNRLKLLKLPPDVQRACETGALDYTKANLLSEVQDAAHRQSLLDRTLEQNLPHAQLRRLVNEVKGSKSPRTDLFTRLDQVKRDLKTAWPDLGSKDRARAERLANELEQLAGRETSERRPQLKKAGEDRKLSTNSDATYSTSTASGT
ncbi:MAG: ParB/RepB/Spo0J family partition protein [Truepera sp.]|jgi:ParB family chromosome partitioning protein|nr:ParB/RepB/Spo0J family partition protein [Truepera sp.]